MPWDEHGDPLARRLYAASAGNLGWYRNMLVGLRKRGDTDDEIVAAWVQFVAAQFPTPQGVYEWREVQIRFLKMDGQWPQQETQNRATA